MVTAIRQSVVIQAGGLIEVRSPDLQPGERADVIILIEVPVTAPVEPGRSKHWRDFAGAVDAGDPHDANNDRIDADLALEYGAAHEPGR